MKRLSGKIAVGTGGACGIGRAICEAYVREGARVVIADLRPADVQETAESIGENAMAVAMNVGDPAAIRAGIAQVIATGGGIDIFVTNAGHFNIALITKITVGDYRRHYDINVTCTIFAIQAVMPSTTRRDGGSIINVASQAGRRGEANVTLYCSTKAAVISLTQSLVLEPATANIRVNGIAPGVEDTPIWDIVDARLAEYENKPKGQKKREVGEAMPLGRMDVPAEIADPCVFLASEEARYITAQTLSVDGGNWMN
jgi:NAD(P)-dependent dehydrogenase (short-subunit alcohol dehydrogenase family)